MINRLIPVHKKLCKSVLNYFYNKDAGTLIRAAIGRALAAIKSGGNEDMIWFNTRELLLFLYFASVA